MSVRPNEPPYWCIHHNKLLLLLLLCLRRRQYCAIAAASACRAGGCCVTDCRRLQPSWRLRSLQLFRLFRRRLPAQPVCQRGRKHGAGTAVSGHVRRKEQVLEQQVRTVGGATACAGEQYRAAGRGRVERGRLEVGIRVVMD